jgi:hypothetical protein
MGQSPWRQTAELCTYCHQPLWGRIETVETAQSPTLGAAPLGPRHPRPWWRADCRPGFADSFVNLLNSAAGGANVPVGS